MENLNAEQVKKALECCNTIGGCKVCPYSCNGKPTDNGECGEKMSLDALSLINKQETEYNELYELLQTYKADSEAYRSYSKTLEKENEGLKTLLDESYDAQNSLTEENERLKLEYAGVEAGAKQLIEKLRKSNAVLIEDNHILATEFKNKVKVDTVRKMQERLKRECLVDSGWEVLQIGTIDQIAKEMLEGADNGIQDK